MKIIPIELIVLGFVAYIAEGTHAVYNNFYCYGWTQEDLDAMPGRTMETQRHHCENNLGHVFTHGNNKEYPNCGTCWCCQRGQVHNNFYCYVWTKDDLTAMGPSRTVETQRRHCENNLGHVFTHGSNKEYPNCGTCWCCQRRQVHNNFYCYVWTKEDLVAMGPGRTDKTQRHHCENNLGHVFTHGNNIEYPNCGTCWCCRRGQVHNNFYCYVWTKDDLTAMGPGRTVETQRHHCENNLGHVFTHGNNKEYPNCGTCWCCQRGQVHNNFYCYVWTKEDLVAMGPGRTVETQRHHCENNLGYVFTHGNNKDYPNCGTCWCCQRQIK